MAQKNSGSAANFGGWPESETLKFNVLKKIPLEDGDALTDRFPPAGAILTAGFMGPSIRMIIETGRSVQKSYLDLMERQGYIKMFSPPPKKMKVAEAEKTT